MMPQVNKNDFEIFNFNAKKMTVEQYRKINEIESWLSNYETTSVLLENLESELNFTDGRLRSADTTMEGGRSSTITRVSEDTLMRKENIISQINYINVRRKQITKALDNLSKDEYIVIKKVYMDNKTYADIAHELNYSVPTCKRIKKRALNKIITAVYFI